MTDKVFEITENRVEQWETVYGIKELGIYGSEHSGLIQKLANEVYRLRASERMSKIEVLEEVITKLGNVAFVESAREVVYGIFKEIKAGK